MQTRLLTLCEVCSQPKLWTEYQERYLLCASHIQCPICRQTSKIPLELKKEIKRRLGMFNN